ncbi:MAG: ABC transporter substrate-binding protein [Microbacteriaceae bacterium]|nr:ABC transporter substrate-binding protein [Microbacteriaceae bacterium]
MKMRRKSRIALALAAASALALAGCTTVDTKPTIGVGVTEEACPDAVNPENGCIYLGVLSDLTEGPFAALAVPITDAQRAFWKRVNEEGGIGGFDIDIDKYTRDTKYVATEHAAAYKDIENHILAIVQSLGTVNTEGVLPDMISNNIVAVPASWWSGYSFKANDGGIILETGYSYCAEAMTGLDWFSENHYKPSVIAAVGYPGDYGGDSAAGVQKWADINDAQTLVVPTGPNQVVGDQSKVIATILQASPRPDAVVIAAGPAETAQIVGGLAANGFQGRFLGSLPTWNPALLGTAAAPALQGLYNHMSPYEGWDGTSKALDAIRDSLNGETPANHGYVIGWALNYPLKAALEAAAAKGTIDRETIVSVIDGLTVDFEGMIPAHTYGPEGKAAVAQEVNISAVDASVELGLKTIAKFYKGTTFDKSDYSAACVASQ